MCLEINSKTPKIATKDIVCYKICVKTTFENIVLTPYQRAELFVGKIHEDTHTEEITPSAFDEYVIGKGVYHTFKYLTDARKELKEWNYMLGGGYEIFRCIIPKGSQYYSGQFWTGQKLCASYGSKQIMLTQRTK